jgi:hypothetical protein
VHDFTKHVTTTGRVINFILSLVTREPNGALKYTRYDFLANAGEEPSMLGETSSYVQTAWILLLDMAPGLLDNIDFISLWSDQGPAHFAVKSTHVFFSWLSTVHNKPMTYRFSYSPSSPRLWSDLACRYFAPHHGKSICDAHAGVLKRKERRRQRAGMCILQKTTA